MVINGYEHVYFADGLKTLLIRSSKYLQHPLHLPCAVAKWSRTVDMLWIHACLRGRKQLVMCKYLPVVLHHPSGMYQESFYIHYTRLCCVVYLSYRLRSREFTAAFCAGRGAMFAADATIALLMPVSNRLFAAGRTHRQSAAPLSAPRAEDK